MYSILIIFIVVVVAVIIYLLNKSPPCDEVIDIGLSGGKVVPKIKKEK